MSSQPTTLARRTVGEWVLQSTKPYQNPFIDVTVDATFTSPSGRQLTIPGFYDGERTWRLRFNPGEIGLWTYRTYSRPYDQELTTEGAFEVTPRESRGFLQATPGRAWGFHYESGEPTFIFGDTVYNIFGVAHCGYDIEPFLERRAHQGHNLLRVRVPVSPFHMPDGYSAWQTRRTWAWGGSEQLPRFDRFDLDYFHTVDQVVARVEELGLGLEMIMEAWGKEFPFNSRQIFTAEWEELWMRYLIARYDAYNCVYFWTPLNEYEYYPNGDWHYKPVADRWAMRIARWIKGVAQHGHIMSVHNGPREPAFAERFAADPEAVDAVMYQEWGTRDEENGWLAAGIEEQIGRAFAGWWGSAVFAEWGYERNPSFPLLVPSHEFCCPEHTRRGGWRGAFTAKGVIHGWENTWGPFLLLEEDQPGMTYMLHLRRFFTQVVPFHRLQPAQELIAHGEQGFGRKPSVLASAERDLVAAYLPVGGVIAFDLPLKGYAAQWFDPRTGELVLAAPSATGSLSFVAPQGGGDHPWDWVLVLKRSGTGAS